MTPVSPPADPLGQSCLRQWRGLPSQCHWRWSAQPSPSSWQRWQQPPAVHKVANKIGFQICLTWPTSTVSPGETFTTTTSPFIGAPTCTLFFIKIWNKFCNIYMVRLARVSFQSLGVGSGCGLILKIFCWNSYQRDEDRLTLIITVLFWPFSSKLTSLRPSEVTYKLSL